MRDSFVIYTKVSEVIEALTDEQVGQLFRAMVEYEKTGEVSISDPVVSIAFIPIRQELDFNNEKWDKTREARSEAGKSGGRPKKANALSEKQKKAKKANAFSEKQTKTKKAEYVSVSVNEYVSPTEIKESTRENTPTPGFTPPTVEEVREYCSEHGYKIDEERFVDFYASKGWMVGKNKMKDWRACVRNWTRTDNSPPTARSGTTKPVQFPQRDYDFDELERQLVRNG